MTTSVSGGASSGYFDQDRRNMSSLLPDSACRVLEIGCGAGSFLEFASNAVDATEVWGVEPDVDAGSRARSRGLNVITGTFPESAAHLSGHFDVVIFNDVLEHMVDPWAALNETARLLSPGGTIIVSLPNIANISTLMEIVRRGDFMYRSHGVLDRTHLRFFTRTSAERMFSDCGFYVERFMPISPVGGIRLRYYARLTASLPFVRAKELGYVQLAFRLRRAV